MEINVWGGEKRMETWGKIDRDRRGEGERTKRVGVIGEQISSTDLCGCGDKYGHNYTCKEV